MNLFPKKKQAVAAAAPEADEPLVEIDVQTSPTTKGATPLLLVIGLGAAAAMLAAYAIIGSQSDSSEAAKAAAIDIRTAKDAPAIEGDTSYLNWINSSRKLAGKISHEGDGTAIVEDGLPLGSAVPRLGVPLGGNDQLQVPSLAEAGDAFGSNPNIKAIGMAGPTSVHASPGGPSGAAASPAPSAQAAKPESRMSAVQNFLDFVPKTANAPSTQAGVPAVLGTGESVPNAATDPAMTQNMQERKAAFMAAARDTGTGYTASIRLAALSTHELKAGAVIPVTLLTGINTDLPGAVSALVSQNVFDSVTGRTLLIPQGTRVVGRYDSAVAYGQTRVLLAWQRLLFPDGSSFDLKGASSSDLAGYAGMPAEVNNHYMRLFGHVLMLSMITSATDAMAGDSGDSTASPASNTATALGQTASQIIQRNMNIQPTLTVVPGTRFNVQVQADMLLADYNKPLPKG